MTAQIHDSILLQGQKFSMVGANGNGLFNPLDYDLRPVPSVTSCWRGYVCEYKTVHNQLILNTLQVNLEGQGPQINGAAPSFAKAMFNNSYNALNLPIDFTGEILAADQFIHALYVHMGFHPAWKYERVYELLISHGNVLDTKEISEQMARMRELMTKQNSEK